MSCFILPFYPFLEYYLLVGSILMMYIPIGSK
nr:MAG TPA: hypothetical protein [Caudoviricetes sp.]